MEDKDKAEKFFKYCGLPQTIIEDAILGCIFLNNDEYINVTNFVKTDMFRFEPNNKIFKIVTQLFESGTVIDKFTVWQEIINSGWDDEFLTQSHVNGLAEGGGAFRAENAVHYAQALASKYASEKAPEIFYNLYMASKEKMLSLKDAVNLGQKYLLKLEEMDNASMKLARLTYNENDLDELLDKKFNDNELGGAPTGLFDLDMALDGLQRGRLYGLIADSGVGKSKMAKQIALNMAEQGKNVFFASYEMSNEELTTDIACMHANINSDAITKTRDYINKAVEKGKYPDAETALAEIKYKLKKSIRYVKSLPITIHEHEEPSVANLRVAVEKHKLQNGDIDLIIVDGTDLFDTGKDIANELRRIYKKLKDMAKRFDCPVLSLHQFNNELKDNKDRFPNIFNIAGGRGIRNNCDVIMMIWRPEVYSDLIKEKPDLAGVCKLIIDKLRYKARPKEPLDLKYNGIKFSSMFDGIKCEIKLT